MMLNHIDDPTPDFEILGPEPMPKVLMPLTMAMCMAVASVTLSLSKWVRELAAFWMMSVSALAKEPITIHTVNE